MDCTAVKGKVVLRVPQDAEVPCDGKMFERKQVGAGGENPEKARKMGMPKTFDIPFLMEKWQMSKTFDRQGGGKIVR